MIVDLILNGVQFNRFVKTRIHVDRLESRVLLSTVGFASPVTTQIAQGDFPAVTFAAGDLNGDGIPDLVVGRDDLQAQVYLGTAEGAFTPGQIYATGGDFLALGDFTNSGKLELATANGIYSGNGDGTFGTIIDRIAIPPGTVNMYAQDVNGDGNLDLVCVTYAAGTGTGSGANPVIGLSVLLGNGDGTFQGVVSTPIGSAANLTQADASVAFGSFTSDGKLDVVTPFGVMLGNGDGTFQKPIPLPFAPASTGATPALPAAPLFAVGDFNGDGNTDLATIPASGNSGEVELFLGTGEGTFTDAGPITVATGETITALSAAALTSSGDTDLIVGMTGSASSQAGASDVAVLVNSGKGTFASPVLFAVSGPPESITAENFNPDGNLDLLSIDGVPGTTTSTGLPLASSAAVLLNSQVSLPVPVLSLQTSANPAIAGNPVTYTATVQPPTTSTSTAATPTGTVTFLNGATVLGTASLVAGKASVMTTTASIGLQSITFTYSGDDNYGNATSTALTQTVLATGAKVPLLLPALSSTITIPAQFVPGDSGTATVTLTNGGGATARGKIDVNFYLSTDGVSDSFPLEQVTPALQNHSIQVGSGQTLSLSARLQLGNYPPGNYFLLAQVIPVSNLTADEVSSSPAVSATTFQSAGLVFGNIGTHHGRQLKVADASGNVATFLLTGPGSGTVTQNNGTTNLLVTGTTTSSRLTIVSHSGFTLNNVIVQGALNTFSAHTTTIAGVANFIGGINRLTLGSASSPNSAALIDIGVSAFLPTLSLGLIGDAVVTSAGPIAEVSAKSWQSGAIDAPSIASLVINGNFGADVRVHDGGKLKSAQIGDISGGTWAVAGGIGVLRVIGGVADANIYAGADTGVDDILGTADDAYSAASIGVLSIGSSVTSTLIAAGVAPLAGETIAMGLMLLPKGSITHITLRGAVDSPSRFLAAHLPKNVLLNSLRVPTATDSHFQV